MADGLLSGVLPAAQSFGDYLKRNLLDLATNPRARLEQAVGQTQDTQRELGGLLAMAKAGDERAKQEFAQRMADMAANMSTAGATVWHGSPYKFERFDPTKIGSGEGAQAYGYGHYVAEAPKVAQVYQKSLSDASSPYTYNWMGQSYEKGAAKDPVAHALGLAYHQNVSTAKKIAKMGLKDAKAGEPYALDMGGVDYYQKMLDTANNLKKSDIKATQGSLYKIDLPDEQIANMLNWDQELGKQTPQIQALAKQHGLAMDDLGGDLVARMDAKKAAGAEAMRQAGIPGIKYFDAQSRGGKQADTQNFVVFPGNEGLLSILERNGLQLK